MLVFIPKLCHLLCKFWNLRFLVCESREEVPLCTPSLPEHCLHRSVLFPSSVFSSNYNFPRF